MNEKLYLQLIKSHPNKVEVLYKGISTIGILDEKTEVAYSDNGVKLYLHNATLTVLASINIDINDSDLIKVGKKLYLIEHSEQDSAFTTICHIQEKP